MTSVDSRLVASGFGTFTGVLVVAFVVGVCGFVNRPLSAQEEAEPDHDVIIVGGGIAGLTAAYSLPKRADVKLLEKNDRVGGRTVSGVYGQFHYAKGTEYLGKPRGALRKVIRKMRQRAQMIPSPMDAAFADGRIFYGSEGLAKYLIEKSSLEEYNRFVSTIQKYSKQYDEVPDFEEDSSLAGLDDITARQWFVDQGFNQVYQERYNVASRGLFGASMEEISALSYIPEIAFDYIGMRRVRDVEQLEEETEIGEDKTHAYSFTTGITQLTTALGNALGERLTLNATVLAVTMDGDLYQVVYRDAQGQQHVLTSYAVILAVPAPVALQIAPTVLSDEQKTIMGQVEYSSYATLSLFSETAIFDQAFDLSVPDGLFFTDLYDSTWVQKFYQSDGQNNGTYIACAYVAPLSYKDHSLDTMPETEIVNRVKADLDTVLPGSGAKVTGHDLHRFQYAYPVMTLGAYKRLTRLHEVTDGLLQLAGDYMIYPTFEAAADSGHRAARKLKKALRRRR